MGYIGIAGWILGNIDVHFYYLQNIDKKKGWYFMATFYYLPKSTTYSGNPTVGCNECYWKRTWYKSN